MPMCSVSSRVRCVGLAVSAALLTAWTAAASEIPRQRLTGHVLPALGEAVRLGPPPGGPETPVTLTIVLAREDPRGFERHLRRATHDDAVERRFLSPAELANRFGPSTTRYERVADHFRGNGFEILNESKNRLTLVVR